MLLSVQLYHEAVLVNLLEVLLFHDSAVSCLQDEIDELIDYCYRKMADLISGYDLSLLCIICPCFPAHICVRILPHALAWNVAPYIRRLFLALLPSELFHVLVMWHLSTVLTVAGVQLAHVSFHNLAFSSPPLSRLSLLQPHQACR